MYCVHCGAEGAATFCAACGQRQNLVAQFRFESDKVDLDGRVSVTNPSNAGGSAIESSVHWTKSIQYEAVLAHPEARVRLSAAGRNAVEGVTGDDLLAVFDAVSPIGFSLGKLTNAILPIYDKLGIKTGHESQGIFDAPAGRVMLAVLCTLAAKSLTIAEVRQDSNECSLSAEIPSGLITNRGKLHVLIAVHDLYVRVSLGTTISGQWYDFGKSKRLIDEMFEAIRVDLTNQQSGRPPRYRRVA
jgi:hypothetical protein